MNDPYKVIEKSLADGKIDLPALAFLGHCAPSVHNTQPWSILIDKSKNRLVIALSDRNPLPHTDPAYRQSWISIGAMVENIVSTSNSFGIPATCKTSGYNVTISLGENKTYKYDASAARTTVDTILKRHSNRGSFTGKPLSSEMVRHITSIASDKSEVRTVLVKDRGDIEKIALMVGDATRLALSSRKIRHELTGHINMPLSRNRQTGIPAGAISRFHKSLTVKHKTKSGLFISSNAKKEADRIRKAQLLAMTFTVSDTYKDWLEAGREYERICLEVTGMGLSQSTNAALAEAPDYYKDVSEVLGVNMRLQTLIRIGYGKKQTVRSGRLPLSSVLHISDNS